MQSQLAENSRPPPFKTIKREREREREREERANITSNDLGINYVEDNDTESVHSTLTSMSNKLRKRNKLIKIAETSEPECTAQKTEFSIKDFFSKCDQIHRKLWICAHLLKISLMENFIFCAVMAGYRRISKRFHSNRL